jgi:hypothetical protein
MTDQEDHGEYEQTSSVAFTGEAAQRLRDAEEAAARLPERQDDDEPDEAA